MTAIHLLRARQKGVCPLCDQRLSGPVNRDHLTPVSRGGTDHTMNLAAVHVRCNTLKGQMTMDEWLKVRARKLMTKKARRNLRAAEHQRRMGRQAGGYCEG